MQGNSGLTCVNFQVNDNTSAAGSPGEVLSRRCVTLLKTALRPDMWAKSELKLQWFDKLLMSVVGCFLLWSPIALCAIKAFVFTVQLTSRVQETHNMAKYAFFTA